MLRFILQKLRKEAVWWTEPPPPIVLSSEKQKLLKREIVKRIKLQRRNRAIPFPDKEDSLPKIPTKLWKDQLYSSQIEHLLESMGVSDGQGRSLR